MEMVHFIPPGQRRLVLLAAQTDSAPVIIHGASGTGKGAIARWIHQNGPRSGRPYLTTRRETSLSEEALKAQGGTLEIPEVGELSLSDQQVLLNLLKTRSVLHPGGNGTRMLVNVRVIVTTSQSLDARAAGGLFNMELLKKLNVFRIEMPGLEKRIEEFEDIVLGILGEITRELHKEHLRDLAPDAWKKLRAHDWPGNLRELRNVLRFATITAQGDRVTADDIPDFGLDHIDFRATREEFEKIYLLELLKTFNWELDRTCEASRMDKDLLLERMAQFGLRHEPESVPPGAPPS
ncbi:MAG: sigma-54-dependent Fis family transcriptional regulator [Bdellovibrionales bacterium]|nr:sigma-54-dependent Fis family transcriptional regulator [Bdellovibrionales bacterium]